MRSTHIMEEIELAHTGNHVGAIGLGAMHLSLSGRPDRPKAIEIIHRALDAGVTHVDTADSYCRDESDKHHNEHLIREALDTYDGDIDDVRIATKGGLMRYGGDWPRNGDPDHLRKTIRESVEALGGAPIFLWQHHAPDPDVPVEKSLQAVREAVDEGLIQYVGVSNYSVDHIEKARGIVDVISVQNQYSLWHRKPERDGTLAYCDDNGLTFFPWGPLGGKNRAKKFSEYREMQAIADQYGVSPPCIALAWLRYKSPVVLPIPGATRPESIEDSVQAADIKITDEDAARIERAVGSES